MGLHKLGICEALFNLMRPRLVTAEDLPSASRPGMEGPVGMPVICVELKIIPSKCQDCKSVLELEVDPS